MWNSVVNKTFKVMCLGYHNILAVETELMVRPVATAYVEQFSASL
jgi:hypothetical protein